MYLVDARPLTISKKTFVDKQVVGDDNTITIGIYEPSSGEFKEQGEEEIRGIELANSIYSNVNGNQD